jgi:hypothetical protein
MTFVRFVTNAKARLYLFHQLYFIGTFPKSKMYNCHLKK